VDQFRPGTAYVRPLILANDVPALNRHNRITWRDVQWSLSATNSTSGTRSMILKAAPDRPYRTGDSIEIASIMSEGRLEYEYRFWLGKAGEPWRITRDFNREPRWIWNTDQLDPGTYSLYVDTRPLHPDAPLIAPRTISINVRDNIDQLWDRLITPYLRDDLWSNAYAYQAGSVLMVPLHHAFRTNDSGRIAEFKDYFTRLVNVAPQGLPSSLLDRVQHLYLGSQFAALAQASGRPDLIPTGLVNVLRNAIEQAWYADPDYAGNPLTSGGMRALLQWKLDGRSSHSLQGQPITDHELFVMAIAADLKFIADMVSQNKSGDPLFNEIYGVGTRTFTQEVFSTSVGGWLLQPGVWRADNSYRYAGNLELRDGILPGVIPGIGQDSSHSHRLPAWLSSFARAALGDSEEEFLFERLRQGLEVQFAEVVLIEPSRDFATYRTTNYMDGHNGVYRYRYVNQQRSDGRPWGYAPFELSITFLSGWWRLLDSDRIKQAYVKQAELFPLSQSAIDGYMGPDRSNEGRHPLLTWPDSFTNGLYETIALMAASM
jgi:hypothetical protein